MNLWAILKVAVRALLRNKMRSALTMLGIIIGISAVITMVSIGQGAQSRLQAALSSRGANMVSVRPGDRRSFGASMGGGAASTLTADDVVAIEREVPGVAAAIPVVGAQAQIVYGNQNWSTRVQGSTQKFPQVSNWPVEKGEFFTEADVRSAARVMVLGKAVADKLFPGQDPTGQIIRVGNLTFRVLGVLKEKGQSMWQNQDDTAVIPYTTVQKKMAGRTIPAVNQIQISASSSSLLPLVRKQTEELLRQRHRIGPGDNDDFNVGLDSDFGELQSQMLSIMTLLLEGIASISLIVGGIGIMNIMLVSVTERTREIGIRMSVGARPSYIRLQFLTESLMLSLAGGILGMLIGGTAAAVIAQLVGFPTLVSGVAVGIAFGVSSVVGILFGYYPAHKAAALDPIEALRYE
jgi:putative ABC transport system permease protein